MNMQVFPRMCFDGHGHSIQLAPESLTGSERVLFCARCGDAVPLSIAIARTPTPTTGTTWTPEMTRTSGTTTGAQ